jgi:hypothetical protein
MRALLVYVSDCAMAAPGYRERFVTARLFFKGIHFVEIVFELEILQNIPPRGL